MSTQMDDRERNGSDPEAGTPTGSRSASAPPLTSKTKFSDDRTFDLKRRRDQLTARVAELQWDLGGLVYEMAVRDQIHADVLVKRAAVLQEADAELGEIERILKLEETGMAGTCPHCGSPHSTGASFCWQCGRPLLAQSPAAGNGAG
jgi:zinc-ribbon domain